MGQAIQYDLAGKHFNSQAALERAVKEYLRQAPRNTEFKSRFLRDIVNTLHPDVLRSPYRSTGDFRILTWEEQCRRGLPTAEQWRGGILVETFFRGLDRWQDVTVYPWKHPSIEQQFIQALRAKANAFIPSPGLFDRCAEPGCSASGFDLEYHHISPPFNEMVQEALRLISAEERENRFGYDKFAEGTCSLADFIPDDHPAVLLLAQLHRGNSWVWLCPKHHKERTP